MTAQKRVFLDSSYFSSRIVGTHLTAIVLNPLELMAIHSGSVQGLETISIQNTTLSEVAFADYDETVNVGKYCCNSTLGAYYILVDSAVITNDTLARGWITGIQILYNLVPLSYFGSTDLYKLSTYYSNGVFVGSTNPTTFDAISAKIAAYSDDINLNDIGYYIFGVTRAIQAV